MNVIVSEQREELTAPLCSQWSADDVFLGGVSSPVIPLFT